MDLDSGIREIAQAILAFPTAAMLLVAFWLYVTRNRRDWGLSQTQASRFLRAALWYCSSGLQNWALGFQSARSRNSWGTRT